MNNRPVYVVDGARTPFIKARGRPGPFTPVDLAVQRGRPLLLRFVALFTVLFLNQTRPELAALAAVASLLVVGTVVPYDGRRLGLRQIWASLVETGVSSASRAWPLAA